MVACPESDRVAWPSQLVNVKLRRSRRQRVVLPTPQTLPELDPTQPAKMVPFQASANIGAGLFRTRTASPTAALAWQASEWRSMVGDGTHTSASMSWIVRSVGRFWMTVKVTVCHRFRHILLDKLDRLC